MFEKEAEEIANKRCHEIMCYGHCSFSSPKHHRCGEWHREYKCALKGAEFGYNKANEWHYVKDGDLPNEDVYVYLLFKEDEYPTVARRHLFKEWEGGLKWCWDCKWGSGYTIEADNDRIIAWKEIVLPKESE